MATLFPEKVNSITLLDISPSPLVNPYENPIYNYLKEL